MSLRYDQPQALRRALEDRLKSQARATTIPLDRLRKEAAFERLLARLAAITPYGSWALKGGLAMLARAGVHARATADADTTWRGQVDQLSATLMGLHRDGLPPEWCPSPPGGEHCLTQAFEV